MPGIKRARIAVVDASVAVKWVVDERHSTAAAGLLARPIGWIAPRLMLVEAAATLRRKVVQRELRTAGAAASLRVLLDAAREGSALCTADRPLARIARARRVHVLGVGAAEA
jgi:predicted nucleic acid-binding protein